MLFIPFLCVFLYYVSYSKRNKHFGVINLLFLVYAASLGLGGIAFYFGALKSVFEIDMLSMLYLSVLLTLMFRGFSRFRDRDFRRIKLENIILIRWLEMFVLIGGIFSLIFFSPFAVIALNGDINLNRVNNSDLIANFAVFGLVNSFAGLFANLFVLAQTFFYLRLIDDTGKFNGVIRNFLLVSSLSYVVYNLAYVGRDGVVLWVMTLAFQYLFFRGFLSTKRRRKFRKLSIAIISIIAIPFVGISIARFGGRDQSTLWYMFNYFYQQSVNFNDQFLVDVPAQYGWFNFPDVVSYLEIVGWSYESPMGFETLTEYFKARGVDPWRFSFFFGMFLTDFGKIGTIVFLFMMTTFVRNILIRVRRTSVFIFSDYIAFVLLYQFVYYGLFYNRYFRANSYLIFMILLVWVLRVSRGGKSKFYFKR